MVKNMLPGNHMHGFQETGPLTFTVDWEKDVCGGGISIT